MKFLKQIYLLLLSAGLLSCASSKSSFDIKYSEYTKKGAPGFHVLVMKAGKVVRNSSFGYASLNPLIKIDEMTRFRIASNTKSFTAASILLLEQANLVNPNDSLSSFFPELPVAMKKIKIKHLIHHTSGLPNYDHLCEHKQLTKKRVTNTEILNWLMSNPQLAFDPGTKFEYSNTGYIVLAMVVERISKMSFPQFVKKNIFTPLKMKDSFFFNTKTENITDARAYGYSAWPWFTLNDRDSCNYTHGDDGIYLNMKDYLKWAKALSSNKLLKDDFRAKIFQSGETENGIKTNYSYGWAILETGQGQAIDHSGSWVGFRTHARFYPESDLWILLLSNYADLPKMEIIEELDDHVSSHDAKVE